MGSRETSNTIASEQSRSVEVSAYDRMVIFSGLGRDPVVLAPEVAERIGYYLCAAAYAAAHGVVRNWREEVFSLGADEELIVTRPANEAPPRIAPLEEPRSFQAP